LPSIDLIEPVGDLLPHRLVGAEAVARLVDIAELHRLADAEAPASAVLLAGDHAEQGRLAGAVRADDADDAAGRQQERQVLDQQPVAEALVHLVRLDHQVAEARAGGMVMAAVSVAFSFCCASNAS
jgi:hypothetical protein